MDGLLRSNPLGLDLTNVPTSNGRGVGLWPRMERPRASCGSGRMEGWVKRRSCGRMLGFFPTTPRKMPTLNRANDMDLQGRRTLTPQHTSRYQVPCGPLPRGTVTVMHGHQNTRNNRTSGLDFRPLRGRQQMWMDVLFFQGRVASLREWADSRKARVLRVGRSPGPARQLLPNEFPWVADI